MFLATEVYIYINYVLTEMVIVKFLCYFKFGQEERRGLIVTCDFVLKCVGNILRDYVVCSVCVLSLMSSHVLAAGACVMYHTAYARHSN
jgi:hypothetical protein